MNVRISEIDKKLDMRLVLRLRQENELFNFTRGIDRTIPAFIFSSEDRTYLTAFFDRSISGLERSGSLRSLNPEITEKYTVITSRINNVESMKIVNELLSGESVTLNRVDITRGFINVYTRFHSSMLDGVSETLSRYVTQNGDSRIEWLGPSPGIRWILELINREYPLSVITYTVPLSEGDLALSEGREGKKALLEVKSDVIRNSGFPCILYSTWDKGIVHPTIHPVSQRDGIYEVDLKNSFLLEVADEANRKHIIRTKKFVRVLGERMEVTVFLPSIQRQEYYSILYAIARKENNRLTVKYLFDYVPDALDFL